MINRVCLVVAIAVMSAAAARGGVAASNVQEGKRIAELWCSGCHAVGREASPGGKAPSFAKVANSIPLSESYLDAWISNPMPPMHKFKLTGDMVSDLVSYLRSLKK